MSVHDLDQLYKESNFKKGGSKKVDEIIAKLLNIFYDRKSFSGIDCYAVWQDLLEALLSEFPNITCSNLIQLETPMKGRGWLQERLVIVRLIATLTPASDESQCFLGHAYRDIENLESAATCYQRAYDMFMRRISGHKYELSEVAWFDACSYLCYLADVENELRRQADAFVHITQAFAMLNKYGEGLKGLNSLKVLGYDTLYRIYIGMRLDDLAEQCRLQLVELKKHPY